MYAQRELFFLPPVPLTARQRADLQRKHAQADIDAARLYGLAEDSANASVSSIEQEKEAARREHREQRDQSEQSEPERETSWRRKIASAWRRLCELLFLSGGRGTVAD